MSPEVLKLVMSFLNAIKTNQPMDLNTFMPFMRKKESVDNMSNMFNNYQ